VRMARSIDLVPVGGEGWLGTSEVREKCSGLDVLVLQDSSPGPVSDTKESSRRCGREAVTDVREKEASLTEDALHVDRCTCRM
jgi:hypothetical protein